MMSVSWKASRPIIARATWPVIATTGVLSMLAVASPVTRLVAPGPEVATHTPARPVAPGVPVGRVRRSLLVPHQHVAQAGKLGERVVERHDRAAGVAEEDFDTLFEQGTAEDLGAGQAFSHGCAP